MANWEFFDNQTPESTKQLVDDLRAGKDVKPSRGPDKVCTFKQVSRVLAGFHDGLADEGVGAGPAIARGPAARQRPRLDRPDGKAGETATAEQQPEATSDEMAAGRHTSTDSAANAPDEQAGDKPSHATPRRQTPRQEDDA